MIHHVTVLRFALGDCTMDGISSKHKSLFLAESMEEARAEVEKNPAIADRLLVLDKKPVCGDREYKRCYPYLTTLEKKWHMAGGNYISSSDSRFCERINEYPIPVHDRIER